jgi:hypothetical protein
MRAGVLVRAGVALVAIVVVAWLVVMERDAHLLHRGQTLANGLSDRTKDACSASSPPPTGCRKFDRAVSDLHAARFLNPDSTPKLVGGVLAAFGQPSARLRVADSVLKSEPENLNAWVQVVAASLVGHDTARSERALAVLRRLDPLDFTGNAGG